MPNYKELKAIYDLGITTTYARDKEMRILAAIKHGANSGPALKEIAGLTADCEEIIAIDFDLGRFVHERKRAEVMIESQPEIGAALMEEVQRTVDRQTARRTALLATMPEKKERVRKLLE